MPFLVNFAIAWETNSSEYKKTSGIFLFLAAKSFNILIVLSLEPSLKTQILNLIFCQILEEKLVFKGLYSVYNILSDFYFRYFSILSWQCRSYYCRWQNYRSSARGKSTTTPTSAGSGNQDPVLRRDMFIKGRLRYAKQGWKWTQWYSRPKIRDQTPKGVADCVSRLRSSK